MLEDLRKELHGLIAKDIDLTDLTDLAVVSKSQELDIEVNKEMYIMMAASKKS